MMEGIKRRVTQLQLWHLYSLMDSWSVSEPRSQVAQMFQFTSHGDSAAISIIIWKMLLISVESVTISSKRSPAKYLSRLNNALHYRAEKCVIQFDSDVHLEN
jgi:hypothetical protein